MLVLSRHKNESIYIGEGVVVTVVDVRGDKVRLGISAPKEVPIYREEMLRVPEIATLYGVPAGVVQPEQRTAKAG